MMNFPQIPRPCHENWDSMSPTEKGRFCKACQKQVIDFTQQSREEVLLYLLQHPYQQVCGRMRSSQLLPETVGHTPEIPTQYTRYRITNAAFYLLFSGALLLHSCGTESSPPEVDERVALYRAVTDTIDIPVIPNPEKPAATRTEAFISGDVILPVQQEEQLVVGNMASSPSYLADTVYSYQDVERMPVFGKGFDSLQAYLREHISLYTQDVAPQASVLMLVRMVVNRYGMIEQAALVQSPQAHTSKVTYKMAQEVLDAIRSMPPWVSGMQNGCPTDVVCYLPVRLSLSK